MTSTKRAILLSVAAVATAAMTAGGCASVQRALGNTKTAPDEFRVVTKAPLSIPPEYNLLPPRPGEPRPQELIPADQARSALFGGQLETDASDGEALLLAKMGVASADPSIRIQIDGAEDNSSYKPRNFVDRILFWRNGDTYVADTILDADAEAIRLQRQELVDDVTGGPVTIERGKTVKLPGL